MMRDRFILDPKENILFIDFAGLRIESRAQVEEIARLVRESVEPRGRRVYAVVNYEGTEVVPEIVEYYGERIKELQSRYAISTVRYSSSGLTRSVLRYLGAAVDLESNAFTTREEAIRAIRESERRVPTRDPLPLSGLFNPRRSLLGKLALGWLAGLAAMAIVYAAGAHIYGDAGQTRALNVAATAAALLTAAAATGAILYASVIRPLREMESLARSLVLGGSFEPVEVAGEDETGQLARVLNETAGQLRRDIERLSGLYHISLMMGTSTEVSRICELLTRKTARLLGAKMCVIMLCDEQRQRIYAQPPAYGISDEHARQLSSGLDEKNIATQVFHGGEPYMSNEVRSDPLISDGAKAPAAPLLFWDFPGFGKRPGRHSSAVETLGVCAVLAVPLRAGERPLGTLMVMNKDGGFVEEDKQLVTIFASQAAHLVANAQLFEQVRRSEERHRQIFESALDGLYRGTPQGRLVTVNPALASMLGYDASRDLEGASLLDLFADGRAAARLLSELDERGQVLDVECELRRRGGEPLPTRMSVRTITDESDGRDYHLGIVRDVTEQKRLTEQLVVSEQLAVVGELVAGVAHEVRNPLCGITTTVSALARRLEDREEVRPFVDVIMTEAGHLNHLMEQLLEHSRPVLPDSDRADVGQLIREVVGEWGEQAEAKGVALAFECAGELPGLRLDRRKMHGVFRNLIDNALHHTGSGGSVRILITPPSAGKTARRELRVEVTDTGAGITADKLPRIFDPFFTTRTMGTGLGLAIVQKTIHDHGGTITARSEPGKGTAFVIALPLG